MPGNETHSDHDVDPVDEADPFTDGDVTGILDAAWDDIQA